MFGVEVDTLFCVCVLLLLCSVVVIDVGLWFIDVGFDVAYRWFNFSDYLSLDVFV